jgi:glutaredoxin
MPKGEGLVAEILVYTLRECPTCERLREVWGERGVAFVERHVEDDQETLDEALRYADMVPIIVHPDGRVEIGFEGEVG